MPDTRHRTEPTGERLRAATFAAIGGGVGIGVCVLQLVSGFGGPPGSPLRRAVQVTNRPLDVVLELCARILSFGNTEPLMGWAIPALFMYWFLIGATFGLVCYWILACCRKK